LPVVVLQTVCYTVSLPDLSREKEGRSSLTAD